MDLKLADAGYDGRNLVSPIIFSGSNGDREQSIHTPCSTDAVNDARNPVSPITFSDSNGDREEGIHTCCSVTTSRVDNYTLPIKDLLVMVKHVQLIVGRPHGSVRFRRRLSVAYGLKQMLCLRRKRQDLDHTGAPRCAVRTGN